MKKAPNPAGSALALFLLVFASAFFFCGMELLEYREEIGTLKDQAGQEAEKAKHAKTHEEAFKKVEAALISGQLKTGTPVKDVRSRYGDPSTARPEGQGQRFLYRSLKGKFLDRPWIFLYFSQDGRLERWDCGHTPACPEYTP